MQEYPEFPTQILPTQILPTQIPEKAIKSVQRTAHKLLLHLAGLLYRSSDISDPILMHIL